MQQLAQKTIQFTEPTIGEAEYLALRQALDLKSLTGDGRFCRESEALLRDMTGAKHVLLTTSCTHALELAMLVLDIKPGDEVILPSFTFTSTANVIMRQGATPVFVDIDPYTFNIDPNKIEAAITPKTRCIMPVHYAGQGCDMDAINIIAKKYGLFVVEDAAQGVGATWDGKPLGTLSDIGCFSFHSTKNIVCGEGGAFITNNIELAHKAEIIREKGTNRSAFLRGEVDKYTWVGLGSSYVLSDVLAAILKTQLLQVDDLNGRRVQIWNKYYEGTADLEAAGYVQRPYFHPKASNNGHIFALLIKNGLRNELMAQLKKLGVNCTFHYIPLHSSPFMVEYFKGNILDLPVTDEVSSSLLRLPLYPHLSEEDVEYVLSSFRDIFYRL